ncbi:MAG: hypothetical protein HYY20_09990 [Candidatus Tectomicrobia bacterium]|uniref:Uncharacterized protein n=1 Tax=Tectimicrobiota bacterium TaxID=2528274 RepID=A0A932FVX9_UNCTE|nr:hypothetical protein [Candidatus Tectomicrobia bacterium]
MSQEGLLNALRGVLGYTDAQWEAWKSNPRNLEVAQRLGDFQKYKVVAEVVSSYGCAAGHKTGDKIVFGADGTLLTQESPEKVCFGALSPLNNYLLLVFEKISSGQDPTKILFNKAHCVDVGVEKGGWGEVVLEIRVEKV